MSQVKVTWERMAEDLRDDGWSWSLPADPETAEIDARTCHEAVCPVCDFVGLTYHPFINQEMRYRAFAVCGECGYFVEF